MNHSTFSTPRILAIVALLAWAVILSPYPTTVFMAGSLACLSLPCYRWLRARFSRNMTVCIYTLCLCLCIVLPFVIISILVTPQINEGIRLLNQWRASGWDLPPGVLEHVATFESWVERTPLINEWFMEMSNNVDSFFSGILNYLRTGTFEFDTQMPLPDEGGATATILSYIVSGSFKVAGSTVNALWILFLLVILTVLAVVYAPTLRKLGLRVTNLPEDSFRRFLASLHSALRAVFVGLLFVSMVQGFLCGIGLKIFGMSQPAFWGLLAAFAAIVPVVGTALIWVPLSVVLWFTNAPWAGIGLLLWGIIVVSGSDNVLRPMLLKTGIDASMFVLLLAILCSMAVFGAVGIIVGPVLVAVGIQAMRESDILGKRGA